MAVVSMANIFNSMDVKSINFGFKKTGLNFFQSEPTTEVELTREEQILNLCERFDKFACRNECSSFLYPNKVSSNFSKF